MKKLLLILSLALGATMQMQADTNKVAPAAIKKDHPVKVRYKNWRGEVAVRTIVPMEIYWGKTDWHPAEQWLLKVWDCDRNAERLYAFEDILEIGVK